MPSNSILLAKNSIQIAAARHVVWEKMLDWRNWTSWETAMEKVSFPGAMHEGSVGKLKLKSAPEVALKVTAFENECSYTSEFELWGTTFVFTHELNESDEQMINLSFAVTANGFTAPIVGNLLKAKLADTLKSSMDNFRRLQDNF